MTDTIWHATDGTTRRSFDSFGDMLDFLNSNTGWWAL